MARFERRKVPNPTRQQPLASVYARNTVRQVSTSSVSQDHLMAVIKKHDTLLTKLLQRFNDFESNIHEKIEKTVDEKLKNVKNDDLKKLENLENEIKYVKDGVNDVSNAVVSLKDTTQVNTPIREENITEQLEEVLKRNNEKLDDLINSVDEIRSNMASVTFIERDKMELKHELTNMFDAVQEKYEKFSSDQSRHLTDWMNSIQYNLQTQDIVNNYNEQKEDLFYPEDVPVEEPPVEDNVENTTNSLDLSMDKEAYEQLEKQIENKIENKGENNDLKIVAVKKKKVENKIELEINEKSD
jgi:hypothetical protein